MFGVHITRHTETEGAGSWWGEEEEDEEKNGSMSTKKGRLRKKMRRKARFEGGSMLRHKFKGYSL